MPKPAPRRVLGVDFSGATDAGRKIWIAECKRGRGHRLALVDLRPASDLPESGKAPTVAIAALARHIVKDPDTIAGFDFPFTLPKRVIDTSTWEAFVAGFASRFPDPDAFRGWALRRAEGRELRRAADRAARTPFNSYNLRIYRQTWWGIAHLLGPLLDSGAALVRPYQPLRAGPHPIVIEACPASSLKAIGFYPSYKGRSGAHRHERKAVLDRLIEMGFLDRPERGIQRILLENIGGDALDAVIAAVATAHAEIERAPDADQKIEGVIYFALPGHPAIVPA
jgi:hypothetical protein